MSKFITANCACFDGLGEMESTYPDGSASGLLIGLTNGIWGKYDFSTGDERKLGILIFQYIDLQKVNEYFFEQGKEIEIFKKLITEKISETSNDKEIISWVQTIINLTQEGFLE